MELEALIYSERSRLVARLRFMLGGDREAAEDLAQETFARAWQRMPAQLGPDAQRAWLRRASGHLAIDELRRRSRRPLSALDDADPSLLACEDMTDPDPVREALAGLTVHERFLVLLRFEAGFSHAEIGQLLEISEEAARKRVSRARLAFLRAHRRARSSQTPVVLLVLRDDRAQPYVSWLRDAGARVRVTRRDPGERELMLADGLLFSGATVDLDPALYGEQLRAPDEAIDRRQDLIDLALVRATLAVGLPYVGICRGGQLLNIVSGGSLYQDLVADGVTRTTHRSGSHEIRTTAEGTLRRLAGRRALVESEHHQAVRRLGSDLRVTATSADGVIETIERVDHTFAAGFQWRPERGDSVAGKLVAEAFVEAIAARASA